MTLLSILTPNTFEQLDSVLTTLGENTPKQNSEDKETKTSMAYEFQNRLLKPMPEIIVLKKSLSPRSQVFE